MVTLTNLFIYLLSGLHLIRSLDVPSAAFVDLTVLSGDSVQVDFNPPYTDGGSAINSYKVEWDTDPGISEIQSITTSTYIQANEIQSISTYTSDINEVQVVQSFATPIPEIQRITVTSATDGSFFLELDTSATGGSLQYSGSIWVNYPASGSRESVEDIISAMNNVSPYGRVTVSRNSISSSEYEYLVTFPLSMGNVPQMNVHTALLTPFGSATALITTHTDGDVLSGTFRLSFEGETTGDINYDATEAEMREALEALKTIGVVEVTRSDIDNQHGYKWTIEFTDSLNDGDVETLVADISGLEASSLNGRPGVNITSTDGNQLGGTFSLSYNGDSVSNLPFDCTAEAFKAALETMISIPKGTVSVDRIGPNGVLAYTWTVQFLDDYQRTHEGDLLDIGYDSTSLHGTGSGISQVEVRKGTKKTIQVLTVAAPRAIVSTDMMYLSYGSLNTSLIPLLPSGACSSAKVEVQTITTSTVDTTTSGGDDTVSPNLMFQLKYNDEITEWISANPRSNGDCTLAAQAIKYALQNLTYFDEISVYSSSTGTSQGCMWTVNFLSSIGDLQQLQVQSKNVVTGSVGAFGSSSIAGDDTIKTATYEDGEKDAIKAQLELLETIGTVTVSSGVPGVNGACTWTITFDTNAGSLPQLAAHTVDQANPSVASTITVSSAVAIPGTSVTLGGYFALSFRNSRTTYLAYDCSARELEIALESLDTIGDLEVSRTMISDENGGFTWTITFLTELGDVDAITFDQLDLTGTVATGVVSQTRKGISPPFNSLDAVNALPLGSALVTDLSSMSLVVANLEEGIAYYFRVSAINSVGQGPFAFADVPFAIPEPQLPGRPTDAQLAVLDGRSIEVIFGSPLLDGGEDIDHYRIEYGSNAFVQEVQQVSVLNTVVNDVQVLESFTGTEAEVQIVYISSTYLGTPILEQQTVVCDATDGSFRLSFDGYYSSTILASATTTDIKNALQDIEIINSVTVTFTGGATTACFPNANHPTGGFIVRFDDVVGRAGDLPLFKSYTNNLVGLRRIDITETVKGDAPISGTFRLSFRGSVTEDISATATATELQTALWALDTIPANGVTVSSVASGSLTNTHSIQWRVTFSHPDLGGDVEDILVESYFNSLAGSGVSISVLTNGLETLTERGGAPVASVRGNEVTGTFTLSFRGHTTDPIDFDVAETVLKTRLEALPNIGTVAVKRRGPSVQKEYSWSITFLAMPGSFPVGAGDVNLLIPNYSTLNGSPVKMNVTKRVTGSPLLEGYMTLSYSNGTFFEMTEDIPVDASASEMEMYLNQLDSIGTVSVERTKRQNGYIWLITFDKCKNVNGVDVCATGDIPLLDVNGTSNNWQHLATEEILPGVGPDSCVGSATGLCQTVITDLSATPYKFILSDLVSGNPYYVRIFAHNVEGYGYPALPVPEFEIPTNNPPGPPPLVRLVQSTATSITVEWDYPRENGGATVMGFELWMDDWAGGNPRLVFDGTDDPSITSFLVRASTSLGVEPGKSYRFMVRAINYCKAADVTKACYGSFSEPVVFAVRSPRAPLPPPMPLRHSKSNIGSQAYGDAEITLRWVPPVDNGGSPVTKYRLYYAGPGSAAFTEITLSPAIPTISAASDDQVMEYSVGNLNEGDVYRFYLIAENAYGRSPPSPHLSVVAGIVPGVDAFGNNTYRAVAPVIKTIEANEISLSWAMPAYNSTGGTPITGYKVYLFSGVGLNTLANPQPVLNEIQMVSTTVNPQISEIQRVTITDVSSGVFTLSLFGVTSEDLSYLASAPTVAAAIEDVLTRAHYSNLNVIASLATTSTSRSWLINFGTFSSALPLIVIDVSRLVNAAASVANDPNHPVLSSVVQTQEVSQPIGGSFTLSYNGVMTIDMPYDVSAAEMKACLEDLPGIPFVTVTRQQNLINGADRGAYKWIITFEGTPGDLSMLYATPGRLTPLDSGVSISVTEQQSGSAALAVYDGTGIPDVRGALVTSLVSEMSYSFKIVPLNALGAGVLSGPSITVIATSGSSAAYTTASGSSLSIGITDQVNEIQIITAQNCLNSVFRVYWGASNYATLWNNFTNDEFEQLVESELEIGDIDVWRSVDSNPSLDITYWRVTFIGAGDVPLLTPLSLSPSCNVSAIQFLQGNRNEFTIEPKKASGAVLREVTTADGFQGLDLFFTETYRDSTWYRDQGLSTYNPVTYEVVSVFFPIAVATSIQLSLLDYLTPDSTRLFTTPFFSAASSAYDVQVALEDLENVDSVDIYRESSASGTQFLITFLSNLGDVPDFSSSNPSVLVAEVQKGVTEVQTIILAADEEFVREEQIITFKYSSLAQFIMTLYSSSTSTPLLSYDCTATEIQDALQTLVSSNGAPVVVTVTKADVILVSGVFTASYTIKFYTPVGDVPQLMINTTNAATVSVVEAIKGYSPVSGTFTIFYENEYTSDINFDASAADMKNALEDLATIGRVQVAREDQGNGYKWTIAFTQNVGNLRMMEPSDYRYEIQRLTTYGGSPTPLYGNIVLSFGNDTVAVPFDSTASELTASLESLPSVGDVEVSLISYSNGRNSWLVTFRSLIGNIETMKASSSMLMGSDAEVEVEVVVTGNANTLVGSNPRLSAMETISGHPDYTAQYVVDTPGKYDIHVMQLTRGGLSASYYDNQWFYGQPSTERIDPVIDFDWQNGLLTQNSFDYVSIRWVGKFAVDKTESIIFYLYADDGARLYLNHSLLIDMWDVCCIENRVTIDLTSNVFYDIMLEYREITGAASVKLSYSSTTIKKQVIPSSKFYFSEQISSSPFTTTVVPGAADYPYTDAYGDALTSATAGTPSHFFIQTKDSMGNNKTTDFEETNPLDLLSVRIDGASSGRTEYYANMEYLGAGLFKASYLPLASGPFQVYVQMGGRDIYCGKGETNKCSPFALTVNPGPTIPSTSEVESPSFESMDYLLEAVAGEFGYFYIQAKDAYGNNQIIGGDDFRAYFTLTTDKEIQYIGNVDDHGDGTYTVHYTIPIAGNYEVSVTLESSEGVSEALQTCKGASAPFIFDRVYDGLTSYRHPNFCSRDNPLLTVVHNELHAPSSTYDDGSQASLAFAVTGVTNSFTISARDEFGNLRMGDDTTHFGGYGDGESDYFLIEFTQMATNDYFRRSTAIDFVTASTPCVSTSNSFKLSFGGKTTADIPCHVTPQALEIILESLHNYQLDVAVELIDGGLTWKIQFLTMLDVWQDPNQRLKLVPPSDSVLTFYNTLSISRPADRGVYPASFTLWYTGTYEVSITNNGVHIIGSPTYVTVENAPVDPTASLATGSGLVGGIAGISLEVLIQAKDTRQVEVQNIMTSAFVTEYTKEVQELTFWTTGNPFHLTFRGHSTPTLTVGTSTVADLLSAFSSPAFGLISILDDSGNAATGALTPAVTLHLTFETLVGDVPTMVCSDPMVCNVAEFQKGDTPYRKEIQALVCTATAGSFSLQLDSNLIGPLLYTATMDDLKVAFASGSVVTTITRSDGSASSGLICAPAGYVVYIQFDELPGDVSDLQITSSTLTPVNSLSLQLTEVGGSLDGVFPIWGTFNFQYKGEVTAAISTAATAAEVQTALRSLDSIGDIHVVKSGYGIPLAADGSAFYPNAVNIFSIWTIFFDSICTGNVNGVPSGNCPTSLGDEPLLSVVTDNVMNIESPIYHQARPSIIATEVLKGYPGNNRSNYDDFDAMTLSLSHRTASRRIGMSEIQLFHCEGGSAGSIVLQFLNDTVVVDGGMSASDLQVALSTGLDGVTVAVTSTDTTICSLVGSDSQIIFEQPLYTVPTIARVGGNASLVVTISPIIEGIDSFAKVTGSPGLYRMVYTPTIAGEYDIFVQISGTDVATDLTPGILVVPTIEYSATTTHNLSQVNQEGVTEYFIFQLRDRFGNELDGPLNPKSSLQLSMNGYVHQDQSDDDRSPSPVAINLSVLRQEPYTDGIYTVVYDPTAAGSYEISVKIRTPGGLLATYYKNLDLSVPLLASTSHLHDGLYHDPYWCSGLSRGNYSSSWYFGDVTSCDPTISDCGCDSTRLDTSLSFSWGFDSPLPFDHIDGGVFPNDFFSVEWDGYLAAPESGTYTFTVYSDHGASFTLNGTTYVNDTPLKMNSVSFKVPLIAQDYSPLVIVYRHAQNQAAFKVTWSGPGLSGTQVLSGDYLAYSRHIINSPITVEVYPGDVEAATSFATGSGLSECVAMSECSFVIQARDTFGNNIFNWGDESWNISIAGIADWAGFDRSFSRVNDVNTSEVQHVTPMIQALGWTFLGRVDATPGQDYLTNPSVDISSSIERGETLYIGTETIMVSLDTSKEFSSTQIPLARPYLGDRIVAGNVYRLENATAGKYLVTYTPYVRGLYQINVQVRSRDEVQFVQFTSEGSLRGSFSLTATSLVNGMTVSQTTNMMDISTLTSILLVNELEALTNLGGRIDVNNLACDSVNCEFEVRFYNMNADLPLLIIDTSQLSGNLVATKVSELTAGSGALDIRNSPFQMFTSPSMTSAEFSIAYGRGLVYGVTGVTSKFRIQTKDAWGNNRLHSQPRDIFKVSAFIADLDYDDNQVTVDGTVVYSGNPDFGGTYDVEFTPFVSGEYTVAVMLAEQLEVQRLFTKWVSLSQRTGYFSLSYGVCTNISPCPTTKRLAWNSNGQDIQNALEELPGIGKVSVQFTQTSDLLNSAWLVTFMSACDMLPITLVSGGSVPLEIEIVEEGRCAIIEAHQGPDAVAGPFVNTLLVEEEQLISLSDASCVVDCSYYLSFRGYQTSLLTWSSTATEIEDALMSLTPIGTVEVSVTQPSANSKLLSVVFLPGAGSTIGHITNLGDLPKIQVVVPSSSDIVGDVTEVTKGKAPFTAFVEAIEVDAASCTAIDVTSQAGKNGLSTGIYLDTTSFQIESRDQYHNRVLYGPLNETQIVETSASSELKGSWKISYGGNIVTVAAKIGIAGMKAALESLPSLGEVMVSTNSVQIDSGLRCSVVTGSPLVTCPSDPALHYVVGDWI